MFARRVRVDYEKDGKRHRCPQAWLDTFSMRNFTNDAIFDDTLPVGDGEMEVGRRVPLDRLRSAIEDWFRRKGYIGKEAAVFLSE